MNHNTGTRWSSTATTFSVGPFGSFTWGVADPDDEKGDSGSKVFAKPKPPPPGLSGGIALPVPVDREFVSASR